MTRTTILTALLVATCLTMAVLAQHAHELYGQALRQEHASGDLERAIALYRQAAQAAGADRALAARALVRAAGAEEKRGRGEAATQGYAEVIRSYPEQRGEVGVARERLDVLRRRAKSDLPGPAATRAGDVSPVTGPFLNRYCVSCHAAATAAGGFELGALDQRNVGATPAQWEKVLRRLLARRDPPAGQPRPSGAVYRDVITALETSLDAAYPATLHAADQVDDATLAMRLARLVWNGAPDAALRDEAERGGLRDREVLNRQVARMLRDSRSASLVDRFFGDWLSLDRVRNPRLDPSRFPAVDAELIQDMTTETRLFLEDQLRNDRDPLELWTAGYTYVNARLARHYGLPNVAGHDFRRVDWPDGRRAGLLGQAGVLAAWSMPTRTSPTLRGRFVLSRFFGLEPPSPPANVPPLSERPPRGATMRDRLAVHQANPACASCHSMFDPIGLALENFDASGVWRTTDDGSPIDTTGRFVDGTPFDGPAGLRAALIKSREAYYSGLTQRLLAYALERRGRSGQVYDYEMPAVRAIVRDGAANGYRWSSLLAGVAASAPFRMTHTVP